MFKKLFPVFLFIAVVSLLFYSKKPQSAFADGTYSAINTTMGNDSGIDAINFSQGKVWTIDKFGKYIWMTEDRSGNHSWAWSNDTGTTWTQGSETYNFLTRGAVAYDSINDKLHVIWTTDTCDSSGGIIYRRYGITRDGSNNITAISREDSSNINLQLDTGGGTCSQPSVIWVNDGSTNGILVAIWSSFGTGVNEVRVSMRKLSLSAADGVSGNWTAPSGSGSTFSINAPNVAANKILGDTTGSSAATIAVRGGSGSRKNDLYAFVAEDDTTNSHTRILSYRGIWSSGSGNWSGGWQSAVVVGQMDMSQGYNLKHQLLSKPVLDTAKDRFYIGWARWKDNTSGDTWSIAYLDSTDTPSSTVDVYSANGTHSYAPTGDIAYDATLGLIDIAYIESTTNGTNGSIDYKTYDGTTLSGSTRFYTTPGGSGGADGSADIPILYDNRSSGRLLFAFRVNGAIPATALDPNKIYFGYATLPTPTPTPTNTPTPTSTPTPTNTPTPTQVQSAPSAPNTFPAPPVCTDSYPGSIAPYIYKTEVLSSSSIKLFFNKGSQPFNKYAIVFGISSGKYYYGLLNVGDINSTSFEIKDLQQGTTYYFKIRQDNGCATGDWSNEVKATTQAFTFPSLINETKPLVDNGQENNNVPVTSKVTITPTETQVNPTPTEIQSQSLNKGETIFDKIVNFFKKVLHLN